MNDQLVTTARSHGLSEILHRSAARYPTKVALIDGDTSLTFAELDAAVDATAAALLDRGLERGARVALLARNSWQFAVLSFATARAGLVLVPVNFMLGADEVAFILGHSGASAVVADQGALQATMAEAVEHAGISPTVRACIGADDAATPAGWESVGAWARGRNSRA